MYIGAGTLLVIVIILLLIWLLQDRSPAGFGQPDPAGARPESHARLWQASVPTVVAVGLRGSLPSARAQATSCSAPRRHGGRSAV